MSKPKQNYLRLIYVDGTSKVVPSSEYKYENRISKLAYASKEEYDPWKK
jgi:hypothetical protein